MRRLKKAAFPITWVVIFVLGSFIVYYGLGNQNLSTWKYISKKIYIEVEQAFVSTVASTLYPGLMCSIEEEEKKGDSFVVSLLEQSLEIFPIYGFLDHQTEYKLEIESAITYEMLTAVNLSSDSEMTGEVQAEVEQLSELSEIKVQEGISYTSEQLADLDFLKNTLYTVDTSTDIGSELLDAEKLLNQDLTIDKNTEGPQILIYHTHSQEGFVDSIVGDANTTIVGVGDYLAAILHDEYGFEVLHNTKIYDLVDGELDRNEAYSLAEPDVKAYLEEYPSIQVVIDLHRDGVDEDTHLVTEINGKQTAQFMFMNGLSYSKKNGSIDYLENPYIFENLATTLQMKLSCETYFPGLARKIYLKSLRYNLHLCPYAMLIEAGAQTNTLEEVKNAMEPLAYVLNEVLSDGE